MTSPDKTRRSVSRAYTRAISEGTGCCTSSGCSPDEAAPLADYAPEQIAGLPASATGSSFGCGDPLSFSGVNPGDTVLDLGSGVGLDLLVAARRVGPDGRVIGVDMTPAMIQAARKHVAEAGVGERVEIRKGLIEDLPVPDASVDWVISNCVINLSPEKERVFSEISRVLRPGGRFSISDIALADDAPALPTDKALHAACIAGAVTESAYVGMLEAAGLTDVTIADRIAYTADTIRTFLASGKAAALGLKPSDLAERFDGKVSSIRITGRNPTE